MAFSQLHKVTRCWAFTKYFSALKIIMFRLHKIRMSLILSECLSALHFMKFNTNLKNTGTYKIKIKGITTIVVFPLMKLIIKTKFNLFKTLELWIVYWINLISFISGTVYLQNWITWFLAIFIVHEAYFTWELGSLQILKHRFVLANLQSIISILHIWMPGESCLQRPNKKRVL